MEMEMATATGRDAAMGKKDPCLVMKQQRDFEEQSS